MRSLIFIVMGLGFAVVSASAQSQEIQLSLEVPSCTMPPNNPLPQKYYGFAKKKEFAWVRGVRAGDLAASGQGDERVDGSGMFDWYTFEKLDINGDGVCDWFLTSIAPYSSGGDSGVLNTLYLGTPKGWSRIGATIPESKPDGLGWGKSTNEQDQYAFSSELPLTLWDQKSQKPYLIGMFYARRDSGRIDEKGYHIYAWDADKNTLKELDKWQPGSVAAKVYSFFKQHGAVNTSATGADRIGKFDPKVEEVELDRGCKKEDILRRSAYFARACKAR